MKKVNLPSGVLQPQPNWNLSPILFPVFNLLNYFFPTKEVSRSYKSKSFCDNESFWHALLENQIRAHQAIELNNFYLFEWFPRSPGLYHTKDAERARRYALDHINYDIAHSPISNPLDHAESYLPKRKESKRNIDHKAVLAPEGKISMLEGGIGSVRLKPIEQEDKILWFMSASANGVAHEGIPLAIPQNIYETIIDEITESGALFCSISGKLKFFPQKFASLFNHFADAPQLYLEVTDVSAASQSKKLISLEEIEVSVAVSFVSNYKVQNGIYATYVTFKPNVKNSFKEATTWLKKEYVEGAYKGKIMTDFDQTQVHFPEAILGLRKVLGKHLDKEALVETASLMYVRGDADELFNRLEREKLRLNYLNVARTKVFVSYSHKDKKWLDKLMTFLTPDIRERNIDVFADTEIQTGEIWRENIDNAIESSKVAILLVSANFMASNFIADFELPKILAAADAGEITVLPLIIAPSSFTENAKLNEFQTVNNPAKPINSLSEFESDQMFLKLSADIKKSLPL